MNTALNYFYRDADNYKQYETVVFQGQIRLPDAREIQECCDSEGFIPSQVGLADLQERMINGVDEETDHVWHEPGLPMFEDTPEEPTTDLTIGELLDNFRKAKGNWDVKAAMERVGLL